MKNMALKRPSPSMIVALLALLFALGGTAFALQKQSGNSLIRKHSLSGNRLQKNSVTGKQVKESTLGTVPSAKTLSSPAASGTTIRGTFSVEGLAAAPLNTNEIQQGLSFGATLASAPAVHYINFGTPVSSGCSGDASNPGASPGNLCIFEGAAPINSTNRGEFDPTIDAGPENQANQYGFAVFADPVATGDYRIRGSWAVTAG
jgi:hypothetical protein